jgi:molybdopterin converting factor small subunit
VLFFGPARELTGERRVSIEGNTVDEVIAAAVARFAGLGALVPRCRVWVNGEPAGMDSPVGPDDELAVLPPVSGG